MQLNMIIMLKWLEDITLNVVSNIVVEMISKKYGRITIRTSEIYSATKWVLYTYDIFIVTSTHVEAITRLVKE